MSNWFEEVKEFTEAQKGTFTIGDVADHLRPSHPETSLKYLKEKISRTLNSMQRWNYVRAVGRSYINGKNITTWEWVSDDDGSAVGGRDVNEMRTIVASLRHVLEAVNSTALRHDEGQVVSDLKQLSWSVECAIERAELILSGMTYR